MQPERQRGRQGGRQRERERQRERDRESPSTNMGFNEETSFRDDKRSRGASRGGSRGAARSASGGDDGNDIDLKFSNGGAAEQPAAASFPLPTLTREHLEEIWYPWFEGYVYSGCFTSRGTFLAICCCKSENPAVPTKVLINYITEATVDDDDFPEKLPRDAVDELIRQGDLDRDGWISYKEFEKLVLHERPEKDSRHLAQTFLEAFVKAVTPIWYHSQYKNCRPPPLFIPVVSLFCIIVFVVYASLLGSVTKCPCDSPLVYSPQFRYEVWRWITYSFVHGSIDHLLINVIIMLLLGIPLEIVHKWHRIAIIWFLGVIAGSLAHSMIDVSYGLVGASGGVYALICAHVANVAINYKEMLYNKIRVIVLVLYIALDVGLVFYYRFRPQTVLVSHGAHLGGAITGALIGLAILRNLKKRFYEGILWKVGLGIYVALVVTAILFNCLYDGFPEQNFDKYRYRCSINTNLPCPYGDRDGQG